MLGAQQKGEDVERFVMLSGCSGGGKSTLLAELARRGHATVPEPGRRVVERERVTGGGALPWRDMAAFARAALAIAIADRAEAPASGLVFFDRGVVDAAAALEAATGAPVLAAAGRAHRYHGTVFLAPPWPEIYRGDAERRHGFAAAVEEYERLAIAYPVLGYRVRVLPTVSVADRADWVLAALAGSQ